MLVVLDPEKQYIEEVSPSTRCFSCKRYAGRRDSRVLCVRDNDQLSCDLPYIDPEDELVNNGNCP